MYATNANLALKQIVIHPFTGTVAGITKTMVGLGNVDNTTDLNKPFLPLQIPLNLKVDKAAGKGLSQRIILLPRKQTSSSNR
jgi:hypothetical protein